MNQIVRVVLLAVLGLSSQLTGAAIVQISNTNELEIKLAEPSAGKLVVTAGRHDFATYDFKPHSKPIFYPVLGPQQVRMTRGFPVEQNEGGRQGLPTSQVDLDWPCHQWS